ncbi:collagen alpha-1(I) chain-like [Leopardus geoffroyi]|uniref:collagen alpha-1(I) chain-like n=1 Tax=Leopardus geoffroyi TaxID=46844 RepID=UPI001E25D7AE|nr:collagen alpha-1(I) chain-like [Leopardus geoffroyi]
MSGASLPGEGRARRTQGLLLPVTRHVARSQETWRLLPRAHIVDRRKGVWSPGLTTCSHTRLEPGLGSSVVPGEEAGGQAAAGWARACLPRAGRVAQGGAAVSRAGRPGPVLASRCALAPAGRAPPPHAQRGFIKSGCEEGPGGRLAPACWLRAPGLQKPGEPHAGFCARVSLRSAAARPPGPGGGGGARGARGAAPPPFRETEAPGATRRGDEPRRLLFRIPLHGHPLCLCLGAREYFLDDQLLELQDTSSMREGDGWSYAKQPPSTQ